MAKKQWMMKAKNKPDQHMNYLQNVMKQCINPWTERSQFLQSPDRPFKLLLDLSDEHCSIHFISKIMGTIVLVPKAFRADIFFIWIWRIRWAQLALWRFFWTCWCRTFWWDLGMNRWLCRLWNPYRIFLGDCVIVSSFF